MESTHCQGTVQAQEIVVMAGGKFVTERVTPRPAAGQPLQTLQEALQGIRIVATGDGEAVSYTATGPRFRIFDPDDPTD